MLLRDALPADAFALEQVRIDSWQGAYAGIVAPDYLAAYGLDAQRVAWREAALAHPDPAQVTLVAEDDGRVVGAAHLAPAGERTAELLTLYVHPDAWRCGAGSALLVEGFARMPQPGQVLWTFEANARARAFYERHAFLPDGARRVLDLGGPTAEVRYRRSP